MSSKRTMEDIERDLADIRMEVSRHWLVRLLNTHDETLRALRLLTANAATYTGNGARGDECALVDPSGRLDDVVEIARRAIIEAEKED